MSGYISAEGRAPEVVKFCPRCGYSEFPNKVDHDTGIMECFECGLAVFIIESSIFDE